MHNLAALGKAKWRLAWWLTIGMVCSYFGFIFLVAFAKDTMGALVAPGLSLGILLGALVIVSAWALTAIYVRWANGAHDHAVRRLRKQHL
ncbi:MAG: DUF485 domain-containing protein [bacterium]